MSPSIAIVGMACRYPDARSPDELWENVLSQRRAFRRIPPERLRLEDYLSTDRNTPDSIYSSEAAVIEAYEFDRVHFRVAGSTFRSADPAHWLALDIADQTLKDGGYPEGEGLPRVSTGVFLGNTLTGEFSRANVLRLRWPYVRRVLEASLIGEKWSAEHRTAFLKELETRYKAPFPPLGEESLAGGLSNTIAGRICNYFNLQGGGYTVDGACASSLLAVTTACTALAAHDVDVALAGGVDLSIDPFELVGFAKTGALATTMMRVYDVRSNGFWPGEGCGFALLMRHEDAVADRRRIYATIEGWGVSSDGNGGITRPEVEGQSLALNRAYRRAGFGIETVTYFEGHGTGTSVGDATELRALSRARREAASAGSPAIIGSVKANIGHTKAAAGVAGLIKTAMALHTNILPPTTGCETPHPELDIEPVTLRTLSQGEDWPADRRLRAGVSAMGFGGINTHVVLEGERPRPEKTSILLRRAFLSSTQDTELFLFGARSTEQLQHQVEHLLTIAARISHAELSDLAAQLERDLRASQVRAAVVAGLPAELASRLETLRSMLQRRGVTQMNSDEGVFFSSATVTPTIGFLFPGQGSPSRLDGGAMRSRFELVRELYGEAGFAPDDDGTATEVAQPAIVTASLAGLRVLKALGITAKVAVGHSLGELSAFHWAGALDERTLLRIATSRGKAMMEIEGPAGAMASVAAGREEVMALLRSDTVVIAGLNTPLQTVLSGEAGDLAAVAARAREKKLSVINLKVSHAFHSPLVAAAAPVLAEHLSHEKFRPLRGIVVSTVTGARLSQNADLAALLYQQITSPVRFMEAATAADCDALDFWIEVGPGQVLGGLMKEMKRTPVISIDAGGPSLNGLLAAAGAAFAAGVPVNHGLLFADRFTRPFDLEWRPQFFVNPCELAPLPETAPRIQVDGQQETALPATVRMQPVAGVTATEIIRQLVAERAELPPSAIKDDSRLLSDLHLNSITVGQLVGEASRRMALPPPISPTDYADATIEEIASTLNERARLGHALREVKKERHPAGVDSWIRPFSVELVESPLTPRQPPPVRGAWKVLAESRDPLADLVRRAFASGQVGQGIIVCLPPAPNEAHVRLLLEGARAVLTTDEPTWFVLVQHGRGAAAFARTLHLEASHVRTCVVDVPRDHPQVVEWVVAEISAVDGYSEAHYDNQGRRWEPVLRPLPTADGPAEFSLTSEDVLVITGGARGITAECALTLAKETGARVALIGLSDPARDEELANNLNRMRAAGATFKYLVADVTDARAVHTAIQRIEAELGPVTGILHGAARNVPTLLGSLDEEAFQRTLAVKVRGARHLLDAINPAGLRLFLSFGSIIARTGLPGEADYGLANEWLTDLTEQWQTRYPGCRCLAVEWSIWSGVGMGARMGRMDAMAQQGITPIPPTDGVSLLLELLKHPPANVPVVVTGRFRSMPTFRFDRPELPLWRFVEQPRVHYPGVELVVESEISIRTDPYLDDHQIQGQRLLPAVMGLEAMAQVAAATIGSAAPPVFEDVSFTRPVVVPEREPLMIRLAALTRAPGLVEVALRSEETNFQVDHFRATCRFNGPTFGDHQRFRDFSNNWSETPRVPIDPERDLYGGILFHRGRFRRLLNYRFLRSTECAAEIAPDGATPWFSQYLPGNLLLGDPGARDAAIHAIQACIPHATLLPVGVERVAFKAVGPSEPRLVHARERSSTGNTFVYDVLIAGTDGSVHESWEGLRLRGVSRGRSQGRWPISLVGPYLERRVRDFLPGADVSVALERNVGMDRRAHSDWTLQRALGERAQIVRQSRGQPLVEGNRGISVAHTGELTLATAGYGSLGCDLEQVVERSALMWQGLLGGPRATLAEIIVRNTGEDIATSGTRTWAAGECLKKAGAVFDSPVLFVSSEDDGWVLLSSGRYMIATCALEVCEREGKLVVAVLAERNHADL